MSVNFIDNLGNTRNVELNECIPLELKLNLTKYSKKYRELGDYLYQYKTYYGYAEQLSSTKMISTDALLYIDELRKLDYEELKKKYTVGIDEYI